jgi:hypothetical protein
MFNKREEGPNQTTPMKRENYTLYKVSAKGIHTPTGI